MQKNLVLTIGICLGIFMGWFWLQGRLWPPRPRDQPKQAKKDETKAEPKLAHGVHLTVNLVTAGEPMVALVHLGGDLQRAKRWFPPVVVAEVKPPEKKEEKKLADELPTKRETIGNAETHLQAILTSKGAGVQKLVLNRFEGADYLGLPTGSKLELVPDDPFRASFLMYHYVDAKDETPVPALGELNWKLEGKETDDDKVERVTFSTHVPGLEHIKITKVYRLGPKDYHLGLTLNIDRVGRGVDAKEQQFRYQMTGAHGLPIEGEWYASKFRETLIGMIENTHLVREMEDSFRISNKLGGERVPAGTRGDSFLQYAAVSTPYFASAIVVDNQQPDKKLGGVDRRNILAWARPTIETQEHKGRLKSISDDVVLFLEGDNLGRYHLLPNVKRHIDEAKIKADEKVVLSYYELADGKRVATWVRRGQTTRPFMDDVTVRVVSEPVVLHANDTVVHQFMLYHGPAKTKLLGQFSGSSAVDSKLVDLYADTLHLRTLTDYRSPGSVSWFFQAIGWTTLLIWCTSLMHWLLYILHFVVLGNWGLSIILLTVVVRGLMFPISRKQALFSIKMQELGPELKKLNEKYKNDPQGKTQATMEIYRKHNVHPLGGCLPVFMQMPIFLGLYYALQESIHFRLAPFIWIENLAAPDMLKWWSESIPYVSDPDSQGGMFYLGPFLNILPILAVVLMFFQQKMMMLPPTDDQQAANQKAMQFAVLFMGILFYKVASGLCLYFIASSLWGLAERRLLPKKKTTETPIVAFSGKGPPKGKGKPTESSNGNGTVKKVKDWWAKLLDDARKK